MPSLTLVVCTQRAVRPLENSMRQGSNSRPSGTTPPLFKARRPQPQQLSWPSANPENRPPTLSSSLYLSNSRPCDPSCSAAFQQRAARVLGPLGCGDPELGALAHDVRQHSAAQEHQVLPPRRVQDAQLEPPQAARVALCSLHRVGLWEAQDIL